MSDPASTDRGQRPYGWRAKLGLIVPPTNSVNEAEWQRVLPEGVTLHTARVALHTDTRSDSGRRHLLDDATKAGADLAAASVDVIAYGCTAGSLILPLDWLTGTLSAETGTPCVATGPAIVAALRAVDARRVAVATPYHDTLNAHEGEFLGDCGIDVVAIRLGIGAGGPHEYTQIARLTAERIKAHALDTAAAGGDALVLSCTDLPTLLLHAELEQILARPVISSNQATLWAALRAARVPVAAIPWGRLMVA
jgi:maleate isomerase/arylmalonate decarboxylase